MRNVYRTRNAIPFNGNKSKQDSGDTLESNLCMCVCGGEGGGWRWKSL